MCSRPVRSEYMRDRFCAVCVRDGWKERMFFVGIQNKIPAGVLKRLAGRGIEKENILLSSMTDMTLDGEFARGCVIVTKETVFVFTGKPNASEVYSFKGIGNREDVMDVRGDDWEERSFPVAEVAKLEVIRIISPM